MPEFAHKRAHRVAHLVQQELGKLLVEGIKDPRVGFVTVTEVRLTDDLRTAQVFVSVVGSDQERQDSLRGLKAAAGYLRREVGHRLKLRYTPDLHFSHDTTLDYAQRMEALLHAAADGAPEPPEPPAQDPLPRPTMGRDMPPESVFTPPPPPPKKKKPARKQRSPRGRAVRKTSFK